MMYDRDEEPDEFAEEDFFDEDPSDEDVAALICPKCFAFMDKSVSSRANGGWLSRHWKTILIALILLGMLLGALLSFPAAI
jgi:hypothetical protein